MSDGGWRAGLVAVIAVPVAVAVGVPVLLVAVDQSGSDSFCSMPTAAAAGGFTSEQVTIARTAAQVGHIRGLPAQADLIILATGFQESGIRNLDYGDRDSVGWLQQRSNWGTISQRMDPAYAAGKFFDALVKIPNWQVLPVTQAAQAVQISAFPDAYAKWVPKAQALLGQLGDVSADACAAAGSAGGGPVPATFDQQGNPRTVAQAIAWVQKAVPSGVPGEPVYGACERYVTLAYGFGGGYPTAISHWNAAGPRHVGDDDVPPRGALVFWRTSNPAGHVGLSLGNGVVASTDFDGHSYRAGRYGIGPISAIDAWGTRLGWRAPSFHVNNGT